MQNCRGCQSRAAAPPSIGPVIAGSPAIACFLCPKDRYPGGRRQHWLRGILRLRACPTGRLAGQSDWQGLRRLTERQHHVIG